MYLIIYLVIVLLQYQLIINTQKNWFNKTKVYLKWSESGTKTLKPLVYIVSLMPFIGLASICVYGFEYWTFRNIKILNP